MRSSNKSRSRNKNHNNRRGNPTNVLNRVFDSAGPEGRVRGTPQQIIDKYQSLAHDSSLAGDRVNAENFLQHSEHYSRMLMEAQHEINERRDAHDAQRQKSQQQQQKSPQKPNADISNEQPDIAGNTSELFPAKTDQPNLVETPESKPVLDVEKKPKRVRQPAQKVKPEEPKAEKTVEPSKPETAAE